MAIALFGLAVFIFLLWEPNIEGRNAHATLFQVYFNDPLLAIAYAASIPFFVGLYQAFKLAASPRSSSALRTIKVCAIIAIGFVLAGEAYLFVVVKGTDDIAGGVAMGIVVILFCTAAAIAAARLERAP
ncbi:MAG: DUF2975 domain-containing protein [Alphaproteobacteria bacterium]|nr:DUF2975 domain-containing protein [Alphaproteobacteria bacterium]